jgi:hypothetical protein
MAKHLKYLWYVLRHKYYVLIECYKLGILWRGLLHDLSKFSPSEWFPYVDYFYGNYPVFKELPAGIKSQYFGKTQEDVERYFDIAWLNHQNLNKHHWQWWILQEDDGGTKALEMPEVYRKEMLADWRGAGKAINGFDDTYNWYLNNKDKMILHDNTREWIEEMLGGTND